MKDLTTLLTNTGFEQQTQAELIASLQELDEDADAYIDKKELGQVLTSIGESLDREELALFMELACEPWAERTNPNLIDINRIARILLPDYSTEHTLAKKVIQSKTMKAKQKSNPNSNNNSREESI